VIVAWIKRYKWYLIGLILVYAALSAWLFFFTDAPQATPFEYEVR
jgi:hypothetical protein